MDNYIYDQCEEEEISLKDAFFYCLRHLKQMLIFGLVCMLLLGGLKGYKTYASDKAMKEQDSLTDSGETDITGEEIEEYKARVIKGLEAKKEQLTTYVEEDELFKMNPYNTYAAKATYFVDSGYKLNAYSSVQDIDYTNTLLDAYCIKLMDKDNLDSIAKKYGINGTLSDYVNISYNNNLLNIQVFNEDQELAYKILHELTDSLSSIHEELDTSICSHSITFVSENTYADSDWVLNKQKDKVNNANNTFTSINSLNENLDNLDNYVGEGSSSKSIIKSFVKFGIIGFAAGIILVGGCYFVAFLLKESVYSADELKEKTGIRVIGNIASDKKRSRFIAWIDGLEQRVTATDYNLIATSIDTFSDNTNVLVAGDVADRAVIESNLKDLIKDKTLIFAGSLEKDINALKALEKCEDVVLLAKCNETSYKSLNAQKERLSDLNKNIVGCVVEE